MDSVEEYPGEVCAGKDDQVLGVGGELHLLHLGVYTGAKHLLPRAGVPQLDCVVLTGRRHPLTARRKCSFYYLQIPTPLNYFKDLHTSLLLVCLIYSLTNAFLCGSGLEPSVCSKDRAKERERERERENDLDNRSDMIKTTPWPL